MTEVVEVYRPATAADAHLVLMRLEEEGIAARIGGDDAPVGIDIGWASAPVIWTAEIDAENAKRICREWEKSRHLTSLSVMPPETDEDTRSAENIAWTCPKCGTDIEKGYDTCWNCLYNPSAC